ncbi:SH3 domain-containing protein [Streptomyces sp. NPDC058646]|uniref:SH3 domain-containing protein n=1 Tax=Streptomyces sp. NPDC058646 TaxID=3346574 RepID=UPI003658E143
MLKPTRTILALTAGSLVLGLVGAGVSVADEGPMTTLPSHETAVEAAAYRSVIGKVVSRGPLKVRSRPNTRSEIVGQLQPNRTVEIGCKTYGESVDGNRIWFRLQDKRDTWENEPVENGPVENGPVETGPGNGGWQNRPNPQTRQYGEERWVAARYVRNQSQVQFCR